MSSGKKLVLLKTKSAVAFVNASFRVCRICTHKDVTNREGMKTIKEKNPPPTLLSS
jgi:hypothetical protein